LLFKRNFGYITEMLLVEKIISILAPHSCLVCEAEGSLLCAWCRPDAILPTPSKCYRCHTQTVDFEVCEKCRRHSRLSNVWVSTSYDGVAKNLVMLLKFERVRTAASLIAEHIAETLPHFADDVIITHVPTATSRRRARGYDQAELIAKLLARRLKKSHAALLLRSGQTRQVGAKRKERLTQLDGAFLGTKPYLLKNKHVLLVDDIVTTGATLEAATKILKESGAKRVYGAVFAQKQ